MSIKIDLLPGYVGLRRWFRRLLWISAALLSSVATVLFVYYYKDKQQLEKVTIEYENLAENERIAQKATADAAAATSAAAPLETTVKFFVDAGQTGVKRAALLDLVSRYIYGPSGDRVTDPANYGAVITSIDVSDGKTLKMAATVPSTRVYADFLLNLRRGSATYPYPNGTLFAADPKTNSVLPSGISGFPPTQQTVPERGFEPQPIPLVIPVNITGTLKTEIVVPTEPGGAGAAAAAPAAGAAAGTPTATPTPAPR